MRVGRKIVSPHTGLVERTAKKGGGRKGESKASPNLAKFQRVVVRTGKARISGGVALRHTTGVEFPRPAIPTSTCITACNISLQISSNKHHHLLTGQPLVRYA